MHEWSAEVTVDRGLAHRLISEQFDAVELAELRLLAEGWDNTVWLADGRWVFRFLPADGRAEFLAAYGSVDDGALLRARVLALLLCTTLGCTRTTRACRPSCARRSPAWIGPPRLSGEAAGRRGGSGERRACRAAGAIAVPGRTSGL